MQRHTTFPIPLTARDFSSTQSTTNLHFNALSALAHRVLNGALHGTAKHDTSLQLLSHTIRNQLRVQVRLANFFNIDLHGNAHLG